MSILSFDVGGTFIKYAFFDANGMIRKQGKVATPMDSQEALFAAFATILTDQQETIEGIALSLPGTIDSETGYVYQGGSLRYNAKTNLKTALETRFSLPVELENDARCAALAELCNGNMKEIENGIVLTFGTGIGGCLILNHEIYKGSHLFSGEVSALLTKDLATYGSHALWGAQGGIPGFVKRVCDAKQVPDTDGTTVFSWIEAQEETAVNLFQQYCKDLAVQLYNLQILIDPQRICLGGGVSANPIFIEGVQSAMNAFYDHFPIPLPRVELMPCRYHNDANLYGAFYHYQQKHSVS